VLLFALVLSVLTTLLFGLAPALHRTGAGLQEALKEGAIRPQRQARSNASGKRWW
jgi:hypothetical protein